MGKKEDTGDQFKIRLSDFEDLSYDMEDMKVSDLRKKGYTKEHAEALVRKEYIQRKFWSDNR